MMITDDEINAFFFCIGNFLNRLDTAIEGNDKRHIIMVGIIYGLVRNPVPFRIPVGNIIIKFVVVFSQEGINHSYGSCSVNIIITVYHYLLPVINSIFEPFNRFFHIVHQKRVIQVFEIGPEKRFCFIVGVNTPLDKQGSKNGIDVQFLSKPVDVFTMSVFLYFPSFGHTALRQKNELYRLILMCKGT